MIKLASTPSDWPAQNIWTNRIHRNDAAAFLSFLILRVLGQEPIAGRYIVTDSKPAPQHEVLRWLATQMGVDNIAVADPPISGGKRLDNTRMLATGFTLRYPDYRAGYANELHEYLASTRTS